MTDHPQELLAEFVDGTLAGRDLARVESHLSECAVCGEEVALAGRARSALAALPEVPVPFGTARSAVRRSRAAPRWWRAPAAWRVAGAAATAAAVVGAVVFVSLRPATETGGGGDGPTSIDAPAGAPEAGAPASDEDTTTGDSRVQQGGARVTLTLERVSGDQGPQSVGRETRRIATRAMRALDEGFPETAVEFYAAVDLASLEQPAQAALSCATQGSPPDRAVVPYVIQETSFQGVPAYLIAFLAGPAADAPYDRVQVLVVDRETCTIRHFARQNL